MPSPDGPATTRRFLGMVNYLAKLIPTLSDLCHPLRQAISKEEWNWNQSCDKAITEIKEAILKTGVLRYLHPTAKITVQCDASSLGLGAAILQEGKPVAFASRALSSAEKNYSQLEKEMLAIVFALRRFDQYVYGREILVESDHQPLETILRKPLHEAPRRLQRMMMELQRYDLTVKYLNGENMYLADTLSRAFLPIIESDYDNDERVCPFNTSQKDFENVENVDGTEIAISDQRLGQIAQHTRNDTLMVRLKTIILDGWPINRREVPLNLMVHYHIRDELAVDGDVILKAFRCVIPRSLRQTIMERIHCGHTGIAWSLQRARMSVFWPGLTADIKNYVRTCETCNRLRQTAQQKETLLQHERPDRPWAKVAADLFSIDKRNFLVTVDYWSNYFELDELRDTASKAASDASEDTLPLMAFPMSSLRTMVRSSQQTNSRPFQHRGCLGIQPQAHTTHNRTNSQRAWWKLRRKFWEQQLPTARMHGLQSSHTGTPPPREWPQTQRNDYWAAARRRYSQWTLTCSCRTSFRCPETLSFPWKRNFLFSVL